MRKKERWLRPLKSSASSPSSSTSGAVSSNSTTTSLVDIVIRYEKQRAIEQKLHDSFADEERAYQVMKNAIDEEKRNLQCEIDQTVPEIQAAIMSLNKINKLHITEMKSFTSPPDLVCVLLGHGASPTWDDALFVLCDMKFLDRLKFFDKDNIQDSRLECTVRAATEAWRVCEAKTKALHTAWKDNEAKKVELQTEFHHLRERTVAIDRVSIVFENIKPVLRKQLHHLKSADETIMGFATESVRSIAFVNLVIGTILVDRVGQVNEAAMWDLLQVLNECRILNERLLDDLNHRQTHVDHLLRQIALSQANLLTCEEDMMSLVTRMSLLTQSLGNIEIKTNALSQIEQSRSPIGRRGLTLLDAAGTFGINKPHKCIAMLQYSITKLPMDVVLQPIGQICTHVTAAFIQEALHSLPSEVHLGFCFYVALGI
ncbi:hypothetical protein DYB32_004706 [Aphanomyces invadans]|uniref:Dynein heavy chain coiled coil stalk domain-containing protein n=1 Tax=Aphanomyces invadans TaxID=157072 RepID=A0A418AWQ9_9STRA|nr:hypothetical protein DYB32_004706 [Aphanomyces invadans]